MQLLKITAVSCASGIVLSQSYVRRYVLLFLFDSDFWYLACRRERSLISTHVANLALRRSGTGTEMNVLYEFAAPETRTPMIRNSNWSIADIWMDTRCNCMLEKGIYLYPLIFLPKRSC